MQQNDPWADFPIEGQSSRNGPAFIDGPPRRPPPQTPDQAALDSLRVTSEQQQQQLRALQIAEQQRDAAAADQARQAAEAGQRNAGTELRRVIDAARRAQRLSRDGYFATGFGSGVARQIEGSSARDVQGELDTIGANTAFNQLTAMRQASPTGGALGAISERELQLLQSTIASLDPGASDAEFQRRMADIITAYEHMLQRIDPSYQPEQPAAGLQESPTPFAGGVPGFRIGPDGNMELDVQGGQRPPPSPPEPPPSMGRQLLDSSINAAAGVGQGLAAIPDAAANAAGAVLAVPADMLGLSGIASDLRNPITIGGAIESAAPTPQDWTGWGVRNAANLLGGFASTPQRGLNALARDIVGDVPSLPASLSAPSRRQIAQSANALDIPLMPADVGGPATRAATAFLAQTPGGARPIVNAASRTTEAAGRALRGIANRAGRPVAAEEAGETATSGALRYRADSRNAASRLYDRAAQLSEGIRVQPQRAIEALNRSIAELGENPAGGEGSRYLTELRDTLTSQFPNGVTVQGIRGMRTQLRDRFLREGLRGSDIERRVNDVVNLASEDVANALGNAGRSEAANLYRQADAAWAARADVIDNVVMPIIGRRGEKSGEQVMRALQSAAQSNGSRLRRFIAALPEEEAGTVRASMIEAMGRSTPGQQNAAGDAFSLNTFLTNWNRLSNSARRTVFTGESFHAIQDLARVAEAARSAGAYANTSRTGGVVMQGATYGVGLTSGGLPAVAATLAAQYVGGRLLASPGVARALARIGGSRSPRQARAAVERLSSIAARNPALASDIGQLQQGLMRALNDNLERPLAASEPNNQQQPNNR